MAGKKRPIGTPGQELLRQRTLAENLKLNRKNYIRLYRAGYWTLDYLRTKLAESGGFADARELENWIDIHTDPNYKTRTSQTKKKKLFVLIDKSKLLNNLATLDDLELAKEMFLKCEKDNQS